MTPDEFIALARSLNKNPKRSAYSGTNYCMTAFEETSAYVERENVDSKVGKCYVKHGEAVSDEIDLTDPAEFAKVWGVFATFSRRDVTEHAEGL